MLIILKKKLILFFIFLFYKKNKMVLVSKKVKLKNTKRLHKILKPWYEAYKYTYNRTLFYMKETQIYDKTSLNKIILSKDACCRSTWI